MTYVRLEDGERWLRRDGSSVVVDGGGICGGTIFHADGSYYSSETFSNGVYFSLSGNSDLDLVELDTPNSVPTEEERTVVSLGFADGVFCVLASDGTEWWLREGETEWSRLPPLPQG